MKKKYILLKTIRFFIVITMIIFLGIILLFIHNQITSTANNFSSLPADIAWFSLIFYIPILFLGIWGLKWTKQKLKEYFPEKYPSRGPLTKKVITRLIFRGMVIIFSLTLILLITIPFVTIYFVTHHHVYYKENSMLQMTYQASDFDLNENVLTLKTDDNYNIWASEIEVDQPKAIIIYLTGIEQPSITQYYPHAKLMKNNGYATILLEVRGHGKSDGNKVCLGYDETLDVKAVIDYIKNKNEYKNIPLIIQGVSMGGSIAINSFGQYEEIDALIAMSPYSSFEDVIIENLKYYGVPDFLCAIEKPIFKIALKANFGSKKVETMNPLVQIQNAKDRPIYLVASERDTSVPVDNTRRLLKVSKKADIWIRDSWEHFIVKKCNLLEVEKDTEYCNNILKFLNQIVEEKSLTQ